MAKNENILKASELRKRGAAELKSLLDEKAEELHKTRFKLALGQQAKTHTLRQLRRDIARLQTVLNEQQRAAT